MYADSLALFYFFTFLSPAAFRSFDEITHQKTGSKLSNRYALWLNSLQQSLRAIKKDARRFVTVAGFLGLLDEPAQLDRRPSLRDKAMSRTAIFSFNQKMYNMARNPETRHRLAMRFAYAMLEAFENDPSKFLHMSSYLDLTDDPVQGEVKDGQQWPHLDRVLPRPTQGRIPPNSEQQRPLQGLARQGLSWHAEIGMQPQPLFPII